MSMDRRKFVKKTSLGLLALPLISNTTWSLRSEIKKNNYFTYERYAQSY